MTIIFGFTCSHNFCTLPVHCLSAPQADATELRRSLEALAALAAEEPAGGVGEGDRFAAATARFRREGLAALGEAEAGLAGALRDHTALAAYVGGERNPKDPDPAALFGLLAAFAADLDAAHAENAAADARAARRAEREKKGVRASKALKGQRQGPGGDPAGTPPGALRRRDRMLAQVRAYRRLHPEDRHLLQADKARGRPDLSHLGFWVTLNPSSSMCPAAKGASCLLWQACAASLPNRLEPGWC